MTTAIETAIAATGSKATYTGASACVIGGMLSNEFAVLTGVVLGVLGLVVNWYFTRKRDRREQAAHDLQMQDMHAKFSRNK